MGKCIIPQNIKIGGVEVEFGSFTEAQVSITIHHSLKKPIKRVVITVPIYGSMYFTQCIDINIEKDEIIYGRYSDYSGCQYNFATASTFDSFFSFKIDNDLKTVTITGNESGSWKYYINPNKTDYVLIAF